MNYEFSSTRNKRTEVTALDALLRHLLLHPLHAVIVTDARGERSPRSPQRPRFGPVGAE